jgi:hypothetical protein
LPFAFDVYFFDGKANVKELHPPAKQKRAPENLLPS